MPSLTLQSDSIQVIDGKTFTLNADLYFAMLECPSSNRSQESTVPSPKASSESTTMNVPRGKVIPSYNPSYALETPCHAMYQQSLSEVKSSVPSTISLTSDTSSPLHVKYHQLP